MQKIFFSLVIINTLIGCTNDNQKQKDHVTNTTYDQITTVANSNVVKVYVDEHGLITANGTPITLNALNSTLGQLKMNNGVIYYSRSNGQGEPPAEAMNVIDLVIKHGIPIQLYTDHTFTHIVTPY